METGCCPIKKYHHFINEIVEDEMNALVLRVTCIFGVVWGDVCRLPVSGVYGVALSALGY